MPSKSSKAKATKTPAKKGPLKDLKPGRVKEDSKVIGGMPYKTWQVEYKPQKL